MYTSHPQSGLDKYETFHKCIFMPGYTANTVARHDVLDQEIDFILKPFLHKLPPEGVRVALDRP
jgi:hypothetical protein